MKRLFSAEQRQANLDVLQGFKELKAHSTTLHSMLDASASISSLVNSQLGTIKETAERLTSQNHQVSDGIVTLLDRARAFDEQIENIRTKMSSDLLALHEQHIRLLERGALLDEALKEVDANLGARINRQKAALEALETTTIDATRRSQQHSDELSSNLERITDRLGVVSEVVSQIAGSFHSFESWVFYFAFSIATYLMTSTASTSGARFFGFSCLFLCLWCEHDKTFGPNVSHRVVRGIAVSLVLCATIVSRVVFISPEERYRSIIRSELQRLRQDQCLRLIADYPEEDDDNGD